MIMATKTLRYTLEQVEDIIFKGFDYQIPDEVMEKISDLAIKVGSPDYVKTPVFKKRENQMKSESTPASKDAFISKKKKGNKGMELNDEEWNSMTTFQATKIESKTGVNSDFNSIRALINKMSDKNYVEISGKIIEIIEKLQNENNEIVLSDLGSNIFEIASSNRYYSKMYADLYTNLSSKFEFIRTKYNENLQKFTGLFNEIEYVDPQVNYDKYCEINKTNEKRRSLAAFYINLMENGIISEDKIVVITRNLLAKVYEFISMENKKNEVEELTETIAVLYKKHLYENDNAENYDEIEGSTISEIVEKIAKSKVKDYKSLTNKTLFKFMDLIDM